MIVSNPLLVIIGPPGAGKSVVGRLAARILGVPFVDTDQRVVKQHGSISTIFAERGEQVFRAIERCEVQKALTENCVVSLGGGAVLDEETQKDLTSVRVAYLSVSADAVRQRIRTSARPLLTEGIASWQVLMNNRREIYERLATTSVDSSHRSAGSIAHELAEWVQQEGNK